MTEIPGEVILAARKAYTKYKILASVQLAQWILESGFGKHSPGNNPFGIKAIEGQDFVLLRTHEVVNGQTVATLAKFRKFESIADAFDAHGALLGTAKVYASCRIYRSDYHMYCIVMGRIYATDPQYGNKLISLIDEYNLTQYDKIIVDNRPIAAGLTIAAGAAATITATNLQPVVHNLDLSAPLHIAIGFIAGASTVLLWAIIEYFKRKGKQVMPSQAFNDALNNLVNSAKAEIADKQNQLDAANAKINDLTNQLTAADADDTAAITQAAAAFAPVQPSLAVDQPTG